MGCNGSKSVEVDAPPLVPPNDERRQKQHEKRKRSQEQLRAGDAEKQNELIQSFQEEAKEWPTRLPWYKRGKHQQGIGILIGAPEALKGLTFVVVSRNSSKYTVSVGFGKDTHFDHNALRLSINCSTVSMSHARLHFSREGKRTKVTVEDTNSLNGTFVLGRPSVRSTRRPMLEKEVRNAPVSLDSIEYIRLGTACVLALDCTNIYFDDEGEEDGSDSDQEGAVKEEDKRDEVEDLLRDDWYFPKPCPPHVAEIAAKGRSVAENPAARKGSRHI